MNPIFEEIINKMSYISSSQTSEEGYPIFQFQIPRGQLGDLAQYGTWYTPILTVKYEPPKFIIEDFVFYSNDEKFINQFKSLIADRIDKKENAETRLVEFLHNNEKNFINMKKNPVKKMSYDDARIFHGLGEPENYHRILKELDIGSCYLIDKDRLITFRTTEQYGHSNKALDKYYKKPIYTQETLEQCTKAVDTLFAQGKIEPDVILEGRIAKICIDNIAKESKKLPNNYEFEQISILQQYAKLQGYKSSTSLDGNTHKVHMNTHYGHVDISIGKTEEDSLKVSYDDKKDVSMELSDLVDKFYYDKNKEKVNKLVSKFKVK